MESDLLEKLKNFNCTTSTQLSKEIAADVLTGKFEMLIQAVELSSISLCEPSFKNIRIGATKIVELVAMEKPELVAPFLEKLLPSLNAKEPQTKWMALRIFGLCSMYNEPISAYAIPCASQCITHKKKGQLCLVSSADLYLGDYGSLSRRNTEQIFSLLMASAQSTLLNEHDWIMESFIKLIPNLNEIEKEQVLAYAEKYKSHTRKTTLARIREIERKINDKKFN